MTLLSLWLLGGFYMPSLCLLYAFFMVIAKSPKTNREHKIVCNIYKMLIYNTIIVLPFGDPSAVCQWSAYSR